MQNDRIHAHVFSEQIADRLDPVYYLTGSTYQTIRNPKKLGDMVSLRRQNPLRGGELSFKYIEISSIDPELGEIVHWKEYTRETLPARARNKARRGDILVGLVRPESGTVAVVPDNMDSSAVSSALAVLVPKNTEPAFLQFILRSRAMSSLMKQKARGAVARAIGTMDLLSLPVPVAQGVSVRHILAELVTVQENLRVSIRELREIPAFINSQIGGLFPAVGHLFEGHHNHPIFTVNYNEICPDRFDVSYYNPSRLKVRDVLRDAGITTLMLRDVVDELEVGANVRIGGVADGIPIIRSINIRDDGTLDDESLWVSADMKIPRVKPGTVLVSIAGSNVGLSAVVPESSKDYGVNQSLAMISLKAGLNPRFFSLYMNSSFGRNQVANLQLISGRPYLNIRSLEQIFIPVLPNSMQDEIVEKIMIETERRRENYAYWRRRYEELETRYLISMDDESGGGIIGGN